MSTLGRIGRIVKVTISGGIGMAAVGSMEAWVRLTWNPGLRDGRLDALEFVGWGIAIYAAVGILLGAGCGIILTLLPSRSGDWFTRSAGRIGVILALVPLIVYAVFWVRLRGAAPPAGGAFNVVLISVDTLRADALTSFRNGEPVPAGLERARTPRLDALAGNSWLFLDASTPIPKTPQAVSTLLTGNSPNRHGLRNLFEVLGEANITLAEILRGKGWATRAVVTNGLIDRPSGMAQGFDVYQPRDGLRAAVKSYFVVDVLARVSSRSARFVLNRFPTLRITPETASAVTDRAVAALEAASSRPFFLWVHYLDPHWPYWPPEPWNGQTDTALAMPPALYEDVRSGKVNIGEMIHRNQMPPSEIERLVSLYAGEVSYMDGEVGRLIEAVQSLSRRSPTIIVFTSDHGESLGEHRYFFSHGDQVYQPTVRVPLIIHVPGSAGRRIESPVSLADIAPTLLDLLKIESPGDMDGRSLLPREQPEVDSQGLEVDRQELLFGASDLSYLAENPWVTIPGEAGKVRYVRQGQWKLVRYPRDIALAQRFDPMLGALNKGRKTLLGTMETTTQGPSSADIIELFDLAVDPLELNDLSKQYPARAGAMTRALDDHLESTLAQDPVERKYDSEMLEQLKSLGYIK